MKPLRPVLCTALAAAVLSSSAVLGQSGVVPAGQLRTDLAARVQEFERRGVNATAGLDGWLFLVAELRFLSQEVFWGSGAGKASRSPKPENADPLPSIVDFQRQLKARGIDLLVVPVPPKAGIYPEKLDPRISAISSGALGPLQSFYDELRASDIDVLDLAPIFAGRRTSGEAVFCETDTHWSGAGCELAAKAIAERVRGKMPPPAGANAFTATSVETNLVGDLVSMLPADAPKPPKETLRLRQVTRAGNPVAPDPKSPILLLGDSHTLVFHEFAGERAGLLDQLALELGTAPDLIGTRGSGATAVRVSLYRKSIKDPGYLAGKKVVVWCFASREFTESEQGWVKVPLSKQAN